MKGGQDHVFLYVAYFSFVKQKKILSQVGREGAEKASWDLPNIRVFHILLLTLAHQSSQ
jgi:hypothetical protein